MSTCQQQLQSGTWTNTFSENQATELQSAVFVKKLLAIAISNIAYMRVVFPEKAFSDRCLEGLHLKVLSNNQSCPRASQMIHWFRGVFDAFDKKYLRMLVLGIYRSCSDPDNVLEMYTFRFSYTSATEMEIYSNDRKISSVSTASETKKATISLLRHLSTLTQTLRPLPDDLRVTMKLYYYDNVTPEDYEPPWFKAAETDVIWVEGKPTKFQLPAVSTAFHSLLLRVVADDTMSSDDELADDQEMTDAAVTGMEVEMADTQSGKEVTVPDVAAQQRSQPPTATDDTQSGQEVMTDGTAAPMQDVSGDHCSHPPPATNECDSPTGEESCHNNVAPQGIRCPCLVNEDDGLMVLCSVCNNWQHAVCFKILEEIAAPERHVCNLCCGPDSDPTDPELAGIQESEAQMICLWRRTLAACLELEVNHINPPELALRLGVAKSLASRLIDRLVSEGCAAQRGKKANVTKSISFLKKNMKRKAMVTLCR